MSHPPVQKGGSMMGCIEKHRFRLHWALQLVPRTPACLRGLRYRSGRHPRTLPRTPRARLASGAARAVWKPKSRLPDGQKQHRKKLLTLSFYMRGEIIIIRRRDDTTNSMDFWKHRSSLFLTEIYLTYDIVYNVLIIPTTKKKGSLCNQVISLSSLWPDMVS